MSKSVKRTPSVKEFDKFIEQLPSEVVQSLQFVPVKEDKAADVPEERDLERDEFWLDLEGARERLKSGENVGPVLSDRLSVLILMDPEEAQALLKDLPPTLEVSTRSGEMHRYYLRGDGVESKDIPSIAELRTGNRYVVAPGSYASNGGGDSWGAYTIEEARKVVEITSDDLPTELKLKKRVGKEENINEHGWRIEKIREEDGVLDGLLTRERPPNLGFMSKEDADKKTVEKLLFWEFSPGTIAKIMREYRDCGEEVTELFTEVFSDFKERGENVVSDVKNAETFKPGSKEMGSLTGSTKKKLEERVFDDDKTSWSCDTKFVTFTEEIMLPSGGKIEEGDTFLLPSDLAAELREKEKAGRYIFKCPRCHEMHFRDEPYKPPVCRNPNCKDSNGKRTDGKFLKPLHPAEHDEVERALVDNYHFATIQETNRTRKAPKIHCYKGGRYIEPGTEGMIKKIIKNKILPNSTPHFRNRVFRNIVDSTGHLEKEFGIGEYEEKVVVGNGVLNLDTLKLSDHDPELLALARVEANYDPDADCPEFKKLLRNTIPKKEERRRLQELLGVALVNRKDYKEIFILVGKTDTGKSTVLKVIELVFGWDNISNETITKLANSKWRLANLRGVLLNISHEVSSGSIRREEDLKAVWDGDRVSVEEKGVQPYKIKPTCEHIFAANTTPQANESDDAFWNRVFVGVSRGRISKSDQDPDLPKKIVEKESSGILNWIIEGYGRVVDNDGFTAEQSEAESADRWLNWGDSIARFLHNCIEYEEGNKITTNELHDLFVRYVDAHDDLEMKSQTSLTKRAKKIPYAKYSDKFRFEGKQRSGFKHITVKLGGTGETSQRVSKNHPQSPQKKLDTEETQEKVPPGNYGGTSSLPPGEREETEKEETEKRSQRVLYKSPQTSQNSGGLRVHVLESFVYKEEAFSPGDTPSLPKEVAKEATKKGYAETISETEDPHSSTSPSQEDKARTVYDIVHNLQDEYDEGVPLDVIKKEAKSSGVSPGFVDEFVEKERKKGRVNRNEREGQVFVKLTERRRPDIGGSEERRG